SEEHTFQGLVKQYPLSTKVKIVAIVMALSILLEHSVANVCTDSQAAINGIEKI
ncbi:7978_t:CDS:1, partial [Acaulospora colombiana]